MPGSSPSPAKWVLDQTVRNRLNRYSLSIAKNARWWLAFVFILALLPHCVSYVKHHPDERHYTDGAMLMIETGDYRTPMTPEGNVRLKKPILTYWIVASSYQLLGVSPFSSRIPFVLLGGLTVVLTYRCAKVLLRSTDLSLLATLLALSHPSIMIATPRSMPDIVLTCSIMISLLGFLSILLRPGIRSWRSTMFAYGGAGLAMAAKGLPGLLFLLVAMTIVFAFRRKRNLRWYQHAIGFTLCVALGGSWFVVMYQLHGDFLFNDFVGDQVTKRVVRQWWRPITDLPLIILVLVAGFLPWLRMLRTPMSNQWHSLRTDLQFANITNWNARQQGFALLTLWSGLYLVAASFVGRVNFRYLAPIAPMCCMIVAWQLGKIDPEKLFAWMQSVARWAYAALMITALAGVSVFYLQHADWMAMLVAWGTLSVLAVILTCRPHRVTWKRPALALSFSILSLMPAYALFHIGTDQAVDQKIVQALEDEAILDRPVLVVAKRAYASRLRVVSEGRLRVLWYEEMADVPAELFSQVAAVVTDGEYATDTGVPVIEIPNGYQVSAKGIIRSLRKGKLAAYLEQSKRMVCISITSPEHRTLMASQPTLPQRDQQ